MSAQYVIVWSLKLLVLVAMTTLIVPRFLLGAIDDKCYGPDPTTQICKRNLLYATVYDERLTNAIKNWVYQCLCICQGAEAILSFKTSMACWHAICYDPDDLIMQGIIGAYDKFDKEIADAKEKKEEVHHKGNVGFCPLYKNMAKILQRSDYLEPDSLSKIAEIMLENKTMVIQEVIEDDNEC